MNIQDFLKKKTVPEAPVRRELAAEVPLTGDCFLRSTHPSPRFQRYFRQPRCA